MLQLIHHFNSRHTNAMTQHEGALSTIMLTLAAMILLVCTALSVSIQPAHATVAPATPLLATSDASSLLQTAEKPKFLPVLEAFRPLITEKNNTIQIQWTIEHGYYLYKKRFSFKSQDDSVILGTPLYSRTGDIKEDEFLGTVEVFHDEITIEIPILSASDSFELAIRFQGCAEAGLCYPPTTVKEIIAPSGTQTQGSTHSPNAINTTAAPDDAPQASAKMNSAAVTPTSNDEEFNRHDANSIAVFVKNSGILLVFGLFFVLGLGLTFTPCVLPMVPILSGIIAGQQQPMTARKGFILSTAYVLGMAITFSIAGIIVSLSGARIQIYMQDPVVLSVFAALFVLLAFAMFGFYELQLPSFLRDKLSNVSQKQEGGNFAGVFIMGILSALVVSPCVSAPLAGALLAMAQAGDIFKGGLALLGLGLGMGAPLIVIGTTGANVLPRAGGWMDSVKAVFGVLLLAVGAWMIRSVLPGGLMMWIWASLLIIPSIYMGALRPASTGWQSLWKGLGIMMLIYGALLLVGAASGQTNPLKPLSLSRANQNTEAHADSDGLTFKRVTTLAEVNAKLAAAQQAGKPALLDYYADWCIACVEMEHTTFQDPRVIDALHDFELIQIDLTDNPDTNLLLDRFDLIGPPSMLFFSKSGKQLTESSIMGEMPADTFLNHLATKVMPNL